MGLFGPSTQLILSQIILFNVIKSLKQAITAKGMAEMVRVLT
jgi:hypothetical protein